MMDYLTTAGTHEVNVRQYRVDIDRRRSKYQSKSVNTVRFKVNIG